MSTPSNPFTRGYEKLSAQRLLVISGNDGRPPLHLPIHPSQAHIHDNEVVGFPCWFGDDFALRSWGDPLPPKVARECPRAGMVQTVVYSVLAEEAGELVHVADVRSEEAARQLVNRVYFQTGFYSRCWEISNAHLSTEGNEALDALADRTASARQLFIPFRIPGRPAIGVQLLLAAWTEGQLQLVQGIAPDQLQEEHRRQGLPECLVEVLTLAALANVRVLIFDADASALEGLRLYEDE